MITGRGATTHRDAMTSSRGTEALAETVAFMTLREEAVVGHVHLLMVVTIGTPTDDAAPARTGDLDRSPN